MKLDMCQRFGQAVCNHFFNWDVREINSLCGNFVMDVMILDNDIFDPGIKN